jgi:RNA recognition motif-containing protein
MSKNLYVGNLSYDTTENTLRTLFSEFGEVQTVNVITDRYTGRPRGFAFVEMATEEGADAAVAGMNGKMVDQRELKVDKAKPQAPRERRSGGGGGGYGGDRDRRSGGGGGYGDRDRSERRGRW